MSEAPRSGTRVILATLVIALFLTILPVPEWADEFRPQWVAMTLIYWALALPARIGVFWAWCAGLVLDVTTGTVLGQHALSLSVAVYLAVELHARIRVFPYLQQAISVWILLLVERLLALWVIGATGQPTPTLTYWLPTLVGMLLWTCAGASPWPEFERQETRCAHLRLELIESSRVKRRSRHGIFCRASGLEVDICALIQRQPMRPELRS